MLGLLGWLPVVGPIIDGIVSVFNKTQDTTVAKYRVDGEVDKELIQSNTQIILAFADQIPVRIARDVIMFPGSAWCGLFVWDKIVAHKYPWLVWNVAPLSGPMLILPAALLAFFFGMSALGTFRK